MCACVCMRVYVCVVYVCMCMRVYFFTDHIQFRAYWLKLILIRTTRYFTDHLICTQPTYYWFDRETNTYAHPSPTLMPLENSRNDRHSEENQRALVCTSLPCSVLPTPFRCTRHTLPLGAHIWVVPRIFPSALPDSQHFPPTKRGRNDASAGKNKFYPV